MIDGGLRKIFQARLPLFHWQAIETGQTGRGIPDINYCCNGKEGWIEFKQTQGRKVSMRPEQVAWIDRRIRAGGRAFIIVRHKTTEGPRKGPAYDDLYIYEGGYVRQLMAIGLESYPLKFYENGPAKWPWDEISLVLQS